MRFAYAQRALQQLGFLAAISQLTKAQSLDNLDEAILNDIIQAYGAHETSTCNTPASASATSFSFDWPGTNNASNWNPDFIKYEQGVFQAIMNHTDATGDKSWSIRIGRGGNMYSHFTPDQWGETMPPQKHAGSPWIDEVQQSVSVNNVLNKKLAAGADFCPGPNTEDKSQCKPYFIHQAGAYQEDPNYTDNDPFISPSLAKHCSGNSCIFASWGTQAHVKTPFTSPIIYINKYTNCDNGIIEHTQMIHNFADPNNSNATNVDQNYFNVGWGGVRSSSLPIAIEPDPVSGALDFADPDNVDYLPLCSWGSDDPNGPAGIGARTDLDALGGYTSFVEDGLVVNLTIPDVLPWCRKANSTCSLQTGSSPTDWTNCMKPTCDQTGDTQLELEIAANSSPNCAYHSLWNDLIVLQCNMHDLGFGRTSPNLQGSEPCKPWANIGFVNVNTEEWLKVAYVRHWSWRPDNRRTYFAVYSTDKDTAIAEANAIFNNVGNPEPLPIEVRHIPDTAPADYNAGALNAFTFVYGKGQQYAATEGKGRRRIGSTSMGPTTRDYTVFTINWYGGAKLQSGSTYTNRAYFFNSELASVKATADELVNKTTLAEIGLEQWSPRKVDIYQTGTNFAVLAASSAGGQTTTCSSSATLVCSGFSTPKPGYIPFFYTTCGALTHLGPDPYHFTPPFGKTFPDHGDMNNMVRSYVCVGQALSIRPTWKLMGFFNATDSGCASLATSTFDETVCPTVASPTVSPSKGPTLSPINPTNSPTSSPSKTPTSSPSKTPTSSPSKTPTSSPLNPTNNPTSSPSKTPTSSPSKTPTSSPSKTPTSSPLNPTNNPTSSPSKTPTSSPSKTPTSSPLNPTSSPSKTPTKTPTSSPINPTNVPTTSPSKNPTVDPTTGPTSSPSKSPIVSPTKGPTSSPSKTPTSSPINPTNVPTSSPSKEPTVSPSKAPTENPTVTPELTGFCSDNPVNRCLPTNMEACDCSSASLFVRKLLKGKSAVDDNTMNRKLAKKTSAPTAPATPPPTAPPTPPPISSPISSQPTNSPTSKPTASPIQCVCLANGPPTSSPTASPTAGPTLAPQPVASCLPKGTTCPGDPSDCCSGECVTRGSNTKCT